jgi:hypothetical protein
MPILFSCFCGKQLQVGEHLAGKPVRCPGCNQIAMVPAGGALPVPASPPRSATSASFVSVPGMESHAQPTQSEPAAASATRTSGKAILSVVLGLASFAGACFLGIPAVAVGIMSMLEIGRSQGALGGKKLAWAGVALGLVGSLCNLPFGGLGVFLGIRAMREQMAESESRRHLKEIGSAMLAYQDEKNGFPPAAMTSTNGQPLLSWRVALLPYLNEDRLYRRFNPNEPWDSENNKKLVEEMPRVYSQSAAESKPGYTFYRVFHKRTEGGSGPTPVFMGFRSLKFSGIKGGAADTFLVVEADEAVPWTKPEEIDFPVSGSIERRLGGIFANDFNVLLADGTVRSFKKGQLSEEQLKSAISIEDDGKLPSP